jgi:hypothetical protein
VLNRFLTLACLTALWFTTCAGESLSASTPKLGLRVIFFGYPGTSREKDFVEFLGRHFAKVGRGELEQFQERQAEGYDVVILDYGELKVVNNHIQFPKNLVTSRFSRPTVTIGATGALVSDRLGLRTGYL